MQMYTEHFLGRIIYNSIIVMILHFASIYPFYYIFFIRGKDKALESKIVSSITITNEGKNII
jgi:hypothetical protein